MIKEYLSLLFTSYIYAGLFLIPVVVFYIFIFYKKMNLAILLTTHKTIILATLILPFMIISYSHNWEHKNVLSKVYSKDSSTSISADVAQLKREVITKNDISPVTNISNNANYIVTRDIIFYLADIILLLSLIGISVLLVRFSIQHIQLAGIKKRSIKEIIDNNISVFTSKEINTAFAIGQINKQIFLPERISDKNKIIILKHELNHFKSNHQKWSLVETIMSHLFWYNPLTHLLQTKGHILREMECDVKTIKEIDKFEYSRALVEAAECIPSTNRYTLLAHSWVGKDDLNRRIENILGERKSKRRLVISTLFVSSIAITAMLFVVSGNINDTFLESEILQKIDREYSQVIQSRATIKLERIPPHFIQTLLVHEDDDFFNHDGVSIKHVTRAVGTNLKSVLTGGPKYISGGSTITQQLAKSFLNEEKSLERKFRELKVARVLEKNFTKNEILEMYLNRVYFGNGSWGLAQGAIRYFGHSYEMLSLEESAMIIPFLEAPKNYNLIDNYPVAKKRQQRLLQKMIALNK